MNSINSPANTTGMIQPTISKKIDPNDYLLARNFLQLEKRFIDCLYYVDYGTSKYTTQPYSLAFRSIILEACSDIISCLEDIYNLKNSDGRTPDLTNYLKKIKNQNPNFFTIQITIPKYHELHSPWRNLHFLNITKKNVDINLPFWDANNAIKHRSGFEEKATLNNARDALCALLSLLLAFYFGDRKEVYSTNSIFSELNFFWYSHFSNYACITPGLGSSIHIPGF